MKWILNGRLRCAIGVCYASSGKLKWMNMFMTCVEIIANIVFEDLAMFEKQRKEKNKENVFNGEKKFLGVRSEFVNGSAIFIE